MKLLLRLWHELGTLQSWLFDGEPHIDGHCYQDKSLKKIGNKYYVLSECECGKKNQSWMGETMYLLNKDNLPKLEEL